MDSTCHSLVVLHLVGRQRSSGARKFCPSRGLFPDVGYGARRLPGWAGGRAGPPLHGQSRRFVFSISLHAVVLTLSRAGPYDELIYVPGNFLLPANVTGPNLPAGAITRISRIYVSSTESVANGRLGLRDLRGAADHGLTLRPSQLEHPEGRTSFDQSRTALIPCLPQHLARFEWNEVSPIATEVRVFPSNGPNTFNDTPCLAARITSTPLLSIPLDSQDLPLKLHLAQPPLEASSTDAEDGLVGTATWKYISPIVFKGGVTAATVEGLLDGDGATQLGDGVGYPDVKPYTVGVEWAAGTEIDFPAAEVLSG